MIMVIIFTVTILLLIIVCVYIYIYNLNFSLHMAFSVFFRLAQLVQRRNRKDSTISALRFSDVRWFPNALGILGGWDDFRFELD